jgi:hypothetical protein
MTISSGAPPIIRRGGGDDALTSLNTSRLLDIVHADQKLYLVFEFLDVDLKRYMEAGNSQGQPLSLELCQVRSSSHLSLSRHSSRLFRGLARNDASYFRIERSALTRVTSPHLPHDF